MLRTAAVLLLALAWTAGAAAQEAFPSRPITVVVPQSAGGATDTVARNIAEQVAQILKQPVVIDNRPGAGGITGGAYVAKSRPDGYTVLLPGPSTVSIPPALRSAKSLGYSVFEDFEPLGLLYTTEQVIVIHPSIPAKNLQEFIAYAKANPGKMNYGSNGVGSLYHLGTEAFKAAAGELKIAHIPYKGGQDAVVATLANEVQMAITAYSTALGHIREGTLRAIAHTGEHRGVAMPELPTVVEQGVPDFTLGSVLSALVPAATPKDRVAILRDAFRQANESAAMTEYYGKIGATRQPMTREAFVKYIGDDQRRFREAARRSDLIKGD